MKNHLIKSRMKIQFLDIKFTDKKKIILVIIGLFYLGSSNSYCQINISGFFDVQYKNSLKGNAGNSVEFGQFEIGLQKTVTKRLSVEGAIAYNSDTQNFELGSGYADFTISNSDQSENSSSNFFQNLGVMVGQFDVPFGIDYHCIASPDRKMVSPPLVIQKSIRCLNSLGLEFYGSNSDFNINLYIVKGFAKLFAYGGRIEIVPFDEFEIGTSYYSDFGTILKNTPRVIGTDIKLSNEQYEIKGEFIWSKGLYEGEIDSSSIKNSNKGYYIQAAHKFEGLLNLPLTAGIRFGRWFENINYAYNENENSSSRVALLLGINIIENAELKVEYIVNKNGTELLDNLLSTQLVLTF